MTRVLQQILRFATLLIGVSAPSVALALATFDVTPTGPQANETTIKLFDNSGTEVKPVVNSRRSFSVEPGAYSVEVYVGGAQIGPRRQTIELAEGNYQLRVNSENGKVDTPVATPTSIGLIPGTGPSGILLSVAQALSGRTESFTPSILQRSSHLFVDQTGPTRSLCRLYGACPTAFRLSVGGIGGSGSNAAEVPNGQRPLLLSITLRTASRAFPATGEPTYLPIKISNAYFGVTSPGQVFKRRTGSSWKACILLGGHYTETKDRGTFMRYRRSQNLEHDGSAGQGLLDFRAGYEVRGEHTFLIFSEARSGSEPKRSTTTPTTVAPRISFARSALLRRRCSAYRPAIPRTG